MTSPSPSYIDQSIRKRGSSQIVGEEPMKKSKTGEDGVESSFDQVLSDSNVRLPLSQFKQRQVVRQKKLAYKRTLGISSADVGGKAEKVCEAAKDAPGGSSGKSVPLTRVCTVSSPVNPSIHPEKKVSVVLSDDSENNKLSGSDIQVERSSEGGGGEQNQSEDSTNDGKGYLASLESDPDENIERNHPMNQELDGGLMFTFPGTDCDLLSALATLASSSFRSLTAAQMLQAVPMYGPAMKRSLELVAENQKHLEEAIAEKKMEDIQIQLQREQHRSRELEKQLNEAKVEQGKVKALEEQVVQLMQNEDLLYTKLRDADAEAQKKQDMKLTEGITECVKGYIDDWRQTMAAKNAGSGSANLQT